MARSVAWIVGFRLLALGLTFAASVITARLLGPELRGELAVMIAIPSLLAAICLLGGDTANLYFAAQSVEEHASVVRFAWIQAAGTAAFVVLPIAAIVIAELPEPIGVPRASFLVALSLTPVLTVILLLGAAESGRRRAVSVAAATAAGAGLWLFGATVAALSAVRDLTLVFSAFAAAQVALGVALVIMSWPATWRGWSLTPAAYLRYAVGTNLSAVALLVLLRLDLPLIQVLAGSRQAGLYSVAVPIAESLLLLSTAIGLVLLPAVATGEADHVRTMRISQLSTHGAMVVAIGLAIASPILVPFLFGPEFNGAVPIVWALLPGIVMFTAGRTLHTFLLATRAVRAATLGSISALAISVVLAVLLIPRLGALGAAIATSAAYASFAVVHATSVANISGGPWHRPFWWPRQEVIRQAFTGLRRTAQ